MEKKKRIEELPTLRPGDRVLRRRRRPRSVIRAVSQNISKLLKRKVNM